MELTRGSPSISWLPADAEEAFCTPGRAQESSDGDRTAIKYENGGKPIMAPIKIDSRSNDRTSVGTSRVVHNKYVSVVGDIC